MNPQIDYINNDSLYVISCNHCAKKNTDACNTCSRKRTEPKPKKECQQCSEKPKKCGCEDKKDNCTVKRSVCNSEHFAVQNYFSELVHDWEKDLAKYNLGISELESINYFTDQTEQGELLNKVQFVFRRGHEVITKEFLVAPKGDKGDKGDSLTWESLTDDQKRVLRGEKGDTPVLGNIIVNYDESPCNTSGNFVFNESTGRYDLYLILPKQRTFQDCLDDIQNLLDQFNATINAKFDALNVKVDSHKQFDFSKLGLHLESDGRTLRLVYDGVTNMNSVLLQIPQQHEYSIRHVDDYYDKWNDTIELLKDGNVVNSIQYANKYKPLDWWILPYPAVIMMANGELITKKLRISAWFSQSGHPAVDETKYAYENGTERNFEFYIQSTSTYLNKTVDGESMWVNSWSSLNYRYDNGTGMLTLPDNGTIEFNTDEGKNYKFMYTPGGFVSVVLYSPDSRPRRYYIPIIDIDDVYGIGNGENQGNSTTYYNIDPNNVPTSVVQCNIHYTYDDQIYNLSNFYDVNDNLINSWVKVGVGIATYKVQNNKKYFLGNFTKVSDVTQQGSFTFSGFNIENISISGSQLVMKFNYNNSIPTYNRMSQLYYYVNQNNSFDNILKVVSQTTNGDTTEKYLLTNFDNQNLIFEADEDDNTIMQVLTDGFHHNVRIVLSHGGNNNTDGVLPVQLSGTSYVLSGLDTALEYFNIWFDTTYGQVPMDEYQESNSIQPENGTVLAGNLFFNNGLYVATCQLTGTPTISQKGDYAYVKTGNQIQIQNLTNKPLTVDIEDHTYTIPSNEVTVEEIEEHEEIQP